jgi:hypothetical protein
LASNRILELGSRFRKVCRLLSRNLAIAAIEAFVEADCCEIERSSTIREL